MECCKGQFEQFLTWRFRFSILIPGELAPPAKTIKPREIWEQMVVHGRDKVLLECMKVQYLKFLETAPKPFY